MTAKEEIIIVCGYGCMFTPQYIKYLERVDHYSTRNHNNIGLIIVCGGRTQKRTNNYITEAIAMASYLCELRIKGIVFNRPPIHLEEKSHSTGENIKNAGRIIRDMHGISPGKNTIVIFCDSSRTLRARLLAIRYLPEFQARIESYDISGGRGARWQVFATLYEYLTLWFPPLDWIKWLLKRFRACCS